MGFRWTLVGLKQVGTHTHARRLEWFQMDPRGVEAPPSVAVRRWLALFQMDPRGVEAADGVQQ